MRTAKTHLPMPSPKAETSLISAIAKIEESSYRLTRPRRALLETVLKLKKPFSAPELERKMNGVNGCDAVTIYRTLPVFVELGILEKCDFSDDMTRYEVKHAHDGHHHHHIVCTSCKAVEPLPFCIVEGQERILKNLGYKNLKHRLEFSGVCQKCS